MRKRFFASFIAIAALAITASGYSNSSKCYINPGHGGHDSDDRPTDLPTELGFTGSQRFYESDGTLARGKFLCAFLENVGVSTKMSRTTNYSSDDLNLSTIAAQSNSYGGYFISLHSNGANNSANYVISEYCGTRSSNSTEKVSGSKKFAYTAAVQHDKNRLTDVTYSTPRAINDYAFNGWNLGVLRTNTQVGYLVESWFHDYRPETLRMKGDAYNRYLAWQLARAYMEYPKGNASGIKGCVVGDIRNTSKGCGYSKYTHRNRDSYLAVNGAKVELINSSGTVVQTMTTDNWHNGVYAFFDVAAGSYTVRVSKSGYKTQTASVSVSNGNSSLKRFNLVEGQNTGITTSPVSVAHGTVYIGSQSTKTVNVTTTGFSTDVSVSVSGAGFTVNTSTLKAGNSSFTVTFKPTKTGYHTGTVTLKSGSFSATVTLSGEGKNPPLTFTEGWNFSEKSGKKNSQWLSTYSKARNMDFGAGKLYVVNAEDGKIAVVNAQTGEFIKDLDMTGVSGGALKVIDVKYFDGKIVACNLASNANDNSKTLKVYVWDNDDAKPRVLLNTTKYDGKARIGDCIGLNGNLTNGYIFFAAGSASEQTEVIRYNIVNGICSGEPDALTPLKEDGDNGEPVKLGLSPRVIPESPFNFWAVGQQYYPTSFKYGKVYCSMNPAALGKVVHGNAFGAFEYRGTTYGVATTYQNATGAETLTLGRAVLADITNGWAQCEALGSYPAAGMGTTRNTSMSTSVATRVNGSDGVEMWVLIHNQGIAYYKYGKVPTYDITPDTTTRVMVSESKVDMGAIDWQTTKSRTITVTGNNLKGDIKLALSGANASLFSLSTTTISQSAGSGYVTIKYAPDAVASHSATLTITSPGIAKIVVPITGSMKEEPSVKGNFQRLGGLWYYHIPAGGTHEAENLVVLNNCSEQHGRAIADPVLVRYLVERGQVWFWNYTTQKTNGRVTIANIGSDGYVVCPANCYAMLFQNSVENETEGSGYDNADNNIIDFSNIGTYGTDTGSSFTGVTDLRGLGYFKNIATLNLSRAKYANYASCSKLTSVDLSQNTKLTNVNLAYNSLTSIDLSANTALTSVNVEGNGITVKPLETTVGGNKTYYLPMKQIAGIIGNGFNVAAMQTGSLKGGELTTINGESAIKFVDDVIYYDYNNGYKGTAVSKTSKFFLRGKASESSKKGDVNMDGFVDVNDVTTLISKILGQNPSPFNEAAGDIDGNGTHDVNDVTSIIGLIVTE